MAIETKASVAVDSLSEEEACDIFRLFGYAPAGAQRLYGGYSSSNFKVSGRRSADDPPVNLLLKINYYGLSIEDLNHQLHVMSHLKTTAFPTNYPHPASDGSLLVESGGRRAMLLDFVEGGVSGSALLAKGEDQAPAILRGLATALAQLHQVSWPGEPKMRDIRTGFPVCNTGDLLRGDELAGLEKDERFADHPVVAYARECFDWLQQLYREGEEDIPWGLIHGDGFLDNTLFREGSEEGGACRFLALIDWEDSCVGPLVLDLAISASACCFTAANELLRERLAVLLRAYMERRPLSPAERAALPDFMAAGAFACAFYRFGEFNVRQPNSDDAAKDSWRLHLDRAKLLRVAEGGARATVEAVLAELPAA